MLVVEELGSLHLGDFKIIYCGGGPIKSAIRIIRPWFRSKEQGLVDRIITAEEALELYAAGVS